MHRDCEAGAHRVAGLDFAVPVDPGNRRMPCCNVWNASPIPSGGVLACARRCGAAFPSRAARRAGPSCRERISGPLEASRAACHARRLAARSAL